MIRSALAAFLLATLFASATSRGEKHKLTVRTHSSVGLTASQADERLAEATKLLMENSGGCEDEVACCVQLIRKGTVVSFGFPGDGLDVIDNPEELAEVFAIPDADIKVVRQINYCDKPCPKFGCFGCTLPGQRNMILDAQVNGSGWAHEFGHAQGLDYHSTDCDYDVMRMSNPGTAVAIDKAECAAFKFGGTPTVCEPPPFIWHFASSIWHTNYCGPGPRCRAFDETDVMLNDSTVVRQKWEAFGTAPASSVRVDGRLTPSELTWDASLFAFWSGNSISHDIHASFLGELWVRGAPGTQFAVESKYKGSWDAVMADDPPGSNGFAGVRISAQQSSVTAPPNGYSGQVQLPFELADSGLRSTSNHTRFFNEFPGQVYSLADFDPGAAAYPYQSMLIEGGVGELCVMLCGPPVRLEGGGVLAGRIHVELPGGFTPAVGFQPMGELIAGTLAGFSFTVTQPDPTAVGTSGVIFYEWFVNDALMTDGTIDSFSFVPEYSGIYNVALQVTDNDGRLAYVERGFWIPPAVGSVDMNSDGDTGLEEHGFVFADPLCFLGPGLEVPPGCEVTGIDGDGDIDLLDFAGLQCSFNQE